MTLGTKPRWDKYDGYVGNYRSVLAADIDLDTEANVVLGVGHDVNGATVIGAGQTGIKGVMIIPVGVDIFGHLLNGGINNQAGDPCDVGKHGEITNFHPTAVSNSFAVVAPGSGNYTLAVTPAPAQTFNSTLAPLNPPAAPVAQNTANIASSADATALKAAIVAVDDNLKASDFTVSGTAPNFTVIAPEGVTIANATNATVTPAASAAAPGTNYYAHADGSISATKGGDGIYIGHTAEASRLIVNVLDATP